MHEVEHTGRRGDERVSCGEHPAPQKALQLKRLKLELHVAGKPWRQPARALRMKKHGCVHEVAREHDLAKLLDGDAHALAEVAIEECKKLGMRRSLGCFA